MMRKILAIFALLAGLAPAVAQVPNFPQTLPANTVVGRLGTGAGPSQAIPFATLSANLFNATNVSSIFDQAFGAVTGTFMVRGTTTWGARAIVGADLPNPSPTSRGGVFAQSVVGGSPTVFCGQSTSFNVCYGQDGRSAIQIDATTNGGANQTFYKANTHLFADGNGSATAATLTPATLSGSSTGPAALAVTQTLNSSAAALGVVDITATESTINAAAAFFRIRAGAAGTTEVFAIRGSAAPLLRLGGAVWLQAGTYNNIFGNATGVGFVNNSGTTQTFAVSNAGVLSIFGSTSGSTTIAAAATASGALTLPAATGTIATQNIDVQTFTSTGGATWTKPAYGKAAIIEVIGAAGGGARRSAGNGSGGGAGCFFRIILPLSSLGATESVTIGAGGAVQSTDNTDGNNGGNTSFGSFITVYGGRGGTQAAAGTAITGGGSANFWDAWAAGSTNGGGFLVGVQAVTVVGANNSAEQCTSATGTTAGNAVQTFGLKALYGGAGGAGHSTTGPASGVQNTSQNAGNGGAGNGAGAGGNGANPGGGGGSGTTQGGSGGNGKITVTVY